MNLPIASKCAENNSKLDNSRIKTVDKSTNQDALSKPVDNPTLLHFQSMIGQSMSVSPSPFGRWLAGNLISADLGTLTVSYLVRKEMTNPFGTLHGGVISAIMDDLIGATIYCMELGGMHSNINFNIDFLEYALLGEQIIARTSVNRIGNKIVNASCEIEVIRNDTSLLLAKGNSNMLKVMC